MFYNGIKRAYESEPTVKYRIGESMGSIHDFVIENGVLKHYVGSDDTVEIPYGVRTIGLAAFRRSRLKTVIFPSSVREIGYDAFRGCSELERVELNDGIVEIDGEAFSYCDHLFEVDIPQSVKEIREGAFYGCRNLVKINLPKKLTHLGERVFCNCERLLTIIIPKSITILREGAFYGCSWLDTVEIPNSVVAIEDEVFGFCHSLKSISLPKEIKVIHTRAFTRSGLTSITIPEGVQMIETSAFSYCEDLQKVTLPNTLTHIGKDAFAYCRSLEEVVIPESVVSIKEFAFACCSHLVKIDIRSLPVEVLGVVGVDAMSTYAENLLNGVKFHDVIKELNFEYAQKYKHKMCERATNNIHLAQYLTSEKILSHKEASDWFMESGERMPIDVKITLLSYIESFDESERSGLDDLKL